MYILCILITFALLPSIITQYSSTVHLGMTQVVSGQFPRIENIRRNAMAKHNSKEPKEHHSSTKGELGYTMISAMHGLEYAGAMN